MINTLNAELNPICHLLAVLGAHHIFHVSGLRVNIECLRQAINISTSNKAPFPFYTTELDLRAFYETLKFWHFLSLLTVWERSADTCIPSQVTILRINPFGAGIIFLILAHPVYKMWIIQEPNKLALWNKLHFEEKKKTMSIEHV